jgi:hypothetical protein
LVAIREHVISRTEDLPAFLEMHPLHKLYGGENAFLLAHYTDAIAAAGFRLDKVLAPFDSAVNFAPYTLASLRTEIAARAGSALPGSAGVVGSLLKLAPVWALARYALNWVDRRPGRLYSFIAHRP